MLRFKAVKLFVLL